jgi:hypothetical protein
MSLFDAIQYPIIVNDLGYIVDCSGIPNKFITKWLSTPSHLSTTEHLREIILNWNEEDEETYI